MNLLFYPCAHCQTTGKAWVSKVEVTCQECGGKGYKLTDLGLHIVQFMSMFCRKDE